MLQPGRISGNSAMICAACPEEPAASLAKPALEPTDKDLASAGWKDCDGPAENDYSGSAEVHAPSTGNWGGTCTCPDGQTYEVGDNNDGCASLACIGGTPSKCEKKQWAPGKWSSKRVECACPSNAGLTSHGTILSQRSGGHRERAAVITCALWW